MTCELSGFAARAEVLDDLAEWDYGAYEGLTTAEICARQPSWQLFRDGCPGGEAPAQVGARADSVLRRLEGLGESATAACFGHGHLLRVLAARWLRLDPCAGQLLSLDVASLSVLGYEHAQRVVRSWNA
jgi:broad specificity phosphatase PhoE